MAKNWYEKLEEKAAKHQQELTELHNERMRKEQEKNEKFNESIRNLMAKCDENIAARERAEYEALRKSAEEKARETVMKANISNNGVNEINSPDIVGAYREMLTNLNVEEMRASLDDMVN